MEMREFGKTGLKVTPLGLGTAELGRCNVVDDAGCARVLNAALDAGYNVIDTAACYGSETRIGKAIGGRRDEYVLVTKCGHKADGRDAEPWSAAIVAQSIDRSLRDLQTDHVDLLLLHSCSADHLDDDNLLAALADCKKSGKARLIGYSGDSNEADKAVGMGLFDAIETSVNICDQQGVDRYVPAASGKGMGVIAKRPVANAAWRDESEFYGPYLDYARPYIERLQTMSFTPTDVGFDGSWIELALRYTVHQPGVSTAITGSIKPDHLAENVRIVEQGPLPAEVLNRLRDLWKQHDDGSWHGQI